MIRDVAGANAAIENLLHERLQAIEARFMGHALAIYGPLEFGLDGEVRKAVEQRTAQNKGRRTGKGKDVGKHLVVVLDTFGGYLDGHGRGTVSSRGGRGSGGRRGADRVRRGPDRGRAKGKGSAFGDLNRIAFDPLSGQATHKEICVRIRRA